MGVFIYDPELEQTSNGSVYCDYCSSYVDLNDEGRRMCTQCNPDLGMEDEYDEDVGLHELDFNKE